MRKSRNTVKPVRIMCLLGLMFSLHGCAVFEAGGDLVDSAAGFFSGGEDNNAPPAPLLEYSPEIEIDQLWSEDNGSGAEDHFLKLILTIAYGKAFAADQNGLLEARDVRSGEVVWSVDSEYSFSAGPGSGIDLVVMGSSDAEVIAFDLESGDEKWKTRVSSEILAVPVLADGKVIIRTIDGKVLALSENDGGKLWEFERSVPALSIRGSSTPLVVGDAVIVGYANGKMTALRLSDGKKMWETSIAIPGGRSEVERLVDLDADPVVSDGVVYISSFQGGTSAVLDIDGDVLWRNEDVSSFTGLGHDWRYVYVSDADSKVWQLDQRNGASLWKQDELKHRGLTTPVAYEDFVVVGDFEGYLHWLAISDGRQLARVQVTDAAIEAQPVVVENTVYVYAKDGTLAAYQARVF